MPFWLRTKLKCFLFVCFNSDLQNRSWGDDAGRAVVSSCGLSRVTWVIVLPHLVAKTGWTKVKMKLRKCLRCIKLCYVSFFLKRNSWTIIPDFLELSGNSRIVPLMPWKHWMTEKWPASTFTLVLCLPSITVFSLLFYILLSLFGIIYLLFVLCYPFCFGVGWYFDKTMVKLTSHWQTLKRDS